MRTSFLGKLVGIAQRFSTAIIVGVAALTVAALFTLPRLGIDADPMSLVPADPRIQELQATQGENLETLVLGVSSPDPFAADSLTLLGAVYAQIRELAPYTSSITPFNLPVFAREGSRLSIRPLSVNGDVPQDEVQRAAFEALIRTNNVARDLVVSPDGRTLVAYFFFDRSDEPVEVMHRIIDIVGPLATVYDVYLDGSLAFVEATYAQLVGDFPKLIGAAAAFILAFIYVSFRSIRSVILPFSVVVVGCVWSLALMSLLGFKISLISIMTPPLVLTIGSSYAIHVVNQYFRDAKDDHGPLLIVHSVQHIGKTILFATLTTIIGFTSLLVTSIGQIKEFVISTSTGIVICAVLAIFFIPAVLVKAPAPSDLQIRKTTEGAVVRAMVGLSRFVLRYRIALVVVAVSLLVAGGVSFFAVKYQTDVVRYFAPRTPIVRARLFLADQIGGIDPINVTIRAPEQTEDFFLQPEVLAALDRAEMRILADPSSRKIVSFMSYLREANGVMTGRSEIQVGLIHLLSRFVSAIAGQTENRTMVQNVSNAEFTQLTMSITYQMQSETVASFEEIVGPLVQTIEAVLIEELGESVSIDFWGSPFLFLTLSEVMFEDQSSSLLVSVSIIFLVSAVAFLSPAFGFLSLVPLLMGIASTAGLMVLFQMPLDMTTVMVFSIAIGVGVDESLHFLIRYRQHCELYPGDHERITRETLVTSGRPIFLTTVSIVGGLMLFALSTFRPIAFFGILVSMILVSAAVGTLVFLPAFLATIKPRVGARLSGGKPAGGATAAL